MVAWLSARVSSPNPEAEALKLAAYDYLRSQHLEPPARSGCAVCCGITVGQREQRLVTQTVAQLSSRTRTALDALVNTQAPEKRPMRIKMLLFPVVPNSPR